MDNIEKFLLLKPPGPAPEGFTVIAIMNVYNEADIIDYSIKHLVDQGIEVYLFDNCSTDNTVELAEKYLGEGLIGIESFPKDGKRKGHNLYKRLLRVEKYAKYSDADWLIHHDSDEFRESPWPEVSMRDALYYVDQQGYNCIDHTIVNFKLTDDDFVSGTDFVKHFLHWDFGHHSGYFIQMKAWKNTTEEVILATNAGHSVSFPSKKVYPYKFLTRHYQFRSDEQAKRKTFVDRRYEKIKEVPNLNNGHKSRSLIYDPNDFEIFDDSFYTKYLKERLTGENIQRG